MNHARNISGMVAGPFGEINFAAALGGLLRSLHGLYSLWRLKTNFSPSDLALYRSHATRFGCLWKGLGWKVSTWVHWVVCHSPQFADLHHNFYLFSSIPTERRNVEFKLDVTHCFKGWKLSKPAACKFGFGLVLNLSALDAGLLLHSAQSRGVKREEDEDA